MSKLTLDEAIQYAKALGTEEENKIDYDKDSPHTFACFATAAVLMTQVRRGRSKQYIRKLFDELVMIFDTPNIFGKSIDLPDVMHRLEKDYDIDFHRIYVCLETESQFIKSAKGATK